jgi:replicative DNA helicase
MNKLELVGGDYVLIELTQKIATSAHIEKHARLLQQFY